MREVDYIIIFGCHVKRILNKRLEYFLSVKYKYKYKKIILSGGIGRFGDYNEARYMKDYLLENKVNENELVLEDESTTTKENVINFIDLLKLNKLDKKTKVVLLTGSFHMSRIKRIIKKYLKNENVEFIFDTVSKGE